jgi:hypothetical protein
MGNNNSTPSSHITEIELKPPTPINSNIISQINANSPQIQIQEQTPNLTQMGINPSSSNPDKNQLLSPDSPQSADEAFAVAVGNIIFFGTAGAVYYPIYRRFLEKKFISFTPGYTPEDIKNYTKKISEKGGHFGGFRSYLSAKLLPLFLMNITSFNPFIYLASLPLAMLGSYPLYVNSNLKALNLPGYASLKNFGELKQLLFQKSSYKGFMFYLTSEVLFFIPFLNYLSHRFEAIRLAYVFGPYFGHEFKNYKEAREFVKVNNAFKHGRFTYNVVPTLINVFTIIQSLTILGQMNPNTVEK